MPKRQHYEQSDDDEEEPQTSKRARAADSSDEEEEASQQHQARARRTDKGKGKARARARDDSDSDEEDARGRGGDEEMDDEEAEEEEFDRIHGPSLQRRLHKYRHKLGVRRFFLCVLMERVILTIIHRALRSMVSSNMSKWPSSCVTNSWNSRLVLKSTLSSVSREFSFDAYVANIFDRTQWKSVLFLLTIYPFFIDSPM